VVFFATGGKVHCDLPPFPFRSQARMPLTVDAGHSSLTGPRERNEDFCGMVTPQGADLENKG
jgi:hypothetical protein